MFKVIGSKEFDKEFQKIKKNAKLGNKDNLLLQKIIDKGIEKLKYSFKYGDHIPKKQIPKEYFKKYGVENLWKLNLNGFWRMIYTVRGDEIEVISIILEVLNHKEYDKKFGYKKS
jgi:mRNA-degrading endonuclease YafQ of YafQ-DinJ toxin-antitoxin module